MLLMFKSLSRIKISASFPTARLPFLLSIPIMLAGVRAVSYTHLTLPTIYSV